MAPFSAFSGLFDRSGDAKTDASKVPKPFAFISDLTEKIAPRANASESCDCALPSKSTSPRAKRQFPRLSRPVHLMRPEYDVVVIGSGYGGGVAASRMARAGESVAVLEMGKEKWPGEYPSTLSEVLPELHISGHAGRAMGVFKSFAGSNPTGMYNLVLGDGQNAFVGLGGTSIINANVFLECDKRTLALNAWPLEIRNNPAVLDLYYARAAEMLQPTPYPDHYLPPKKLLVLEKQAEALGQKQNFYRVPQTTFFHDGVNNAGVEMKASTCTGQDSTGLNDGSKNSVLVNYISDAWNWGAEIFCECEVRYISKDPRGGYIIYYAWHGVGREKFEHVFHENLMWVRAKELCFLGAGSLGTTEILLRSRAHGLQMSPMIGQKLSGNGDILSFGYDTNEVVNGIGRANPLAHDPTGPTITGIIDNRDAVTSPNVLDAYVIQEGAIPEALAPLIQSMLELLPEQHRSQHLKARDQLHHLMSRAEARFLGPYSNGGSISRTQTYLVMSHDSNEAVLTLENNKPRLQFLGVGRTEHVKRLNEVLAKATHTIGGTLINSPFHAVLNQQEQITVHPLGGAVMSSDGTGRSGATDHLGQVFCGEGPEVHHGLTCVDGAVIPTSLGANPLATITALAERAIDLITEKKRLRIDRTKNDRLDLFGKPAVSVSLPSDLVEAQRVLRMAAGTGGVQFTEIMDGYMHIGNAIDDFTIAERAAKASSSVGSLYLSVSAGSTKSGRHLGDPGAVASGTFSCRALSKEPLLARGKVYFFSADESISDGTNLAYHLTLRTTDGSTYHLHGKKNINSSIGLSITSTWKATTTLHTTLTHSDGSLAGKGILRISLRNFTSELKTFSALPTGNLLNRTTTLANFVSDFAQHTAPYTLGPFRPLQPSANDHYHEPATPSSITTTKTPAATSTSNPPKRPPTITTTVTASDGVSSTLRTWYPTTTTRNHNNPPPTILMIPGASVTHAIFALPTVRTNAIDHFTSRGHTVHVLSHRFSATHVCAAGGTAWEARLDVLAALQHLRGGGDKEHEHENEGAKERQKVEHVEWCDAHGREKGPVV
ncbi:Fumarate reductase/succinate dehydrogenase flavoprotein [Macrophomina phaseolina MS6]|uniref:Cholesterol oxidase n=1 Tax=Macrophomina phaseolina (strain MS6) TaxID=1126212 RepID=K2T0Y4_MACPH|nr:Fumarate reductase/succinate dehydrogenase flavoprotein [Macrophomina phaseolina MS6]